jgi:hypothetical protein
MTHPTPTHLFVERVGGSSTPKRVVDQVTVYTSFLPLQKFGLQKRQPDLVPGLILTFSPHAGFIQMVTSESLNRLVANVADSSASPVSAARPNCTTKKTRGGTMIQVYEHYISHNLSKATPFPFRLRHQLVWMILLLPHPYHGQRSFHHLDSRTVS